VNGTARPVPAVPDVWWRSPKRVLLVIGVISVALGILGGAYAFAHRHDTICKDGLAPKSQRDYDLGRVQFLCHDGEIVTRP
jgi:hypothetical protein